eukprot:CAMPEP_0184496842 /NCGR_PEP_ID=MMETSP0113_2-20130426/35026_1 /TAXON_ID=91329 /ORGANISM="Norrisiella sphaerica, Strain BC52" /LENGTH=267 /DNA_ID=CAMNT_0026883669 /DNA_START=82 /DNA_END=885 /DNA_ORIENTATION=-
MQTQKSTSSAITEIKQNKLKQNSSSRSPNNGSAAFILPRLILSSVGPAQSLDFLQRNGVTHILNLTGPDIGTGKPRYPNKYPKQFKYLHICKRDETTTSIKEYTEKGHEFIRGALLNDSRVEKRPNAEGAWEENARANVVLVHCEAGISRSATTVITYLMKHEGMRLREAYELVKKKKENVGPNIGFFRQCIKLDKQIQEVKGKSSPDRKSMEIEEYAGLQMLETGGIFASYAKAGKVNIKMIVQHLKGNGCDIAATQNYFLNRLLS